MSTNNSFQLDQYCLSDSIGTGPLGEVSLLKSKESGKLHIIKVFNKNIPKINNKKESKKILQEIEIISKFQFPSIVQFNGFCQIQHKNSAIVSEFISDRSLHQIIQSKNNAKFNDTTKLIIIYGIAKGLSYLHSNGIIHCNLKTENIIVDDNYHPYITDFALSKSIHSVLNKKSIKSTYKIHGNVSNFPPEFFTDYEYTQKGDVYAFSMILYEILTGKKPFVDVKFTKIVDDIRKGVRPKLNKSIPKAFQKLIKKCWDNDSYNRPSFDQIVELLKTNPDFITDNIDREKYLCYIDHCIESKEMKTIQQNDIKEKVIKENIENNLDVDKQANEIVGNEKTKTESNKEEYTKNVESEEIDTKQEQNNTLLSKPRKRNLNKNPKEIEAEQMLVQYEESYEKQKVLYEYDSMYFTSRAIYNLSSEAYLISHRMKYLTKKEEALKNMEDIIEKVSISTLANHAVFLYGTKSTENPDYDKISKYLKRAGLKGYNDCLEYYINLIEDNNVINNNLSELGYIYELLSYYEKSLDKNERAKECFENSIKYYKEGIKSKDPESMYRYSLLIEKGLVKPKKKDLFLELVKKAASMNHPSSMCKYAEIIEKNNNYNKSHDYRAIELYQKAASFNHPDAMFKYAQILEEICVIKSDRLKSIELYHKAACLDHPGAMYRYAKILDEGRGIMADKLKAIDYLKKAADNGIVDAMFDFALMNQFGQMMPINKQAAIKYYRMAADKGHIDSKHNLDMMLANGDEIQSDLVESN